MSKATITFDLSIPEDAYDYHCSMVAVEACTLLESLKHLARQYRKHDLLSEVVLHDIVTQLDEWKDVQ